MMMVAYRSPARTFVAVFVTTLAVTSCKSSEAGSGTEDAGIMGKPLFSCGYANFARHDTAYGYVLDDQGQIWSYDRGATWSPRSVGDGLYEESALRERFTNPVLQSREVDSEQLAAMQRMAVLARAGRIERKSTARDSGGASCEAYLWERFDAYREVELGTTGDWTIRNSSPEAEQLQTLLKGELGMGVGPNRVFVDPRASPGF